MEKLLYQLADQLKKHDVAENASLSITMNEGEPAIVQVRQGPTIRIFVQDELLEELLETHVIQL